MEFNRFENVNDWIKYCLEPRCNVTQYGQVIVGYEPTLNSTLSEEELENVYDINSFGPTSDLFDKDGNQIFEWGNETYTRLSNGSADNYEDIIQEQNEQLQKIADFGLEWDREQLENLGLDSVE